jgi:hypothetical protein
MKRRRDRGDRDQPDRRANVASQAGQGRRVIPDDAGQMARVARQVPQANPVRKARQVCRARAAKLVRQARWERKVPPDRTAGPARPDRPVNYRRSNR